MLSVVFSGVIIEESLQDKSVLRLVEIQNTRIEPVTDRHQTPWLKQWTLHSFNVPDEHAKTLAEKLSRLLDNNYWYADFKNRTWHYIVFPDRVFKVKRSKPEKYKPVISYGLGLSIPRHQLDFSPVIKEWER